MVALLTSVLLVIGALSVDLGNAWARKRDLQSQADVAAMAAANWGVDTGNMPAITGTQQQAVALKVAEYMLEAGNDAIGQSLGAAPALAGVLRNGNSSDGEVLFTNDGETVQVITPPADVNFGLAAAAGFEDTDVRADATVQLFSEVPGADVMPLWLPQGCPYGPAEGDTSNGGGPDEEVPADDGDGTGVDPSQTAEINVSVSPGSAAQGAGPVTLTFTAGPTTRLRLDKTPQVFFQLGTKKYDVNGTWVLPAVGTTWNFTATIGNANVTGTAGAWSFQVKNHNRYSGVGTFTVTGEVEESTDCPGADRGNFGQLNSPRDPFGTGSRNNRLGLNFLHGLDHALHPYFNAPADNCEKPSLLADAQLDDEVREGNNCIVGDTGNDGPYVYDGLIGGMDGEPGRLNVANGATRAGCNGGNTTVNGVTINNDLLSCYLQPGYTLDDIAQSSGVSTEMLDPKVVDSPRFVWIPIVYASDREIKDFQPIKTFAPAFITDEEVGQSATSDNGLPVNGNSIEKVVVFIFNADALDESDRNPVIDYDATYGRPVVHLVD